MFVYKQKEINVGTVTGDKWYHSSDTPYVEGVEYYNYTDFDVTITDRLGVEIELLRLDKTPDYLGHRGMVVARVTRLVDPRRVNVPSTDASLDVDRLFLESFKKEVERRRGLFGPYIPEKEQTRVWLQVEMELPIRAQTSVQRSNLLGITIRTTSNVVDKSHGDTPDGYIRDTIIPELREADYASDEGIEKGTRTLFSARLIDNNNRIGTLWTTGFGEVTKIIPIKDEEQQEGLYLAGGYLLAHKEFIPIEELLEPKRMLSLNVHQTEIDARKFGLGEHTISVIAEREKVKKEKNDLKTENKKLQVKIEDLEDKAKLERINRAHSEFKQTVVLESVKENGINNALAGVNRLVSTLVSNIKIFIGFIAILKAI